MNRGILKVSLSTALIFIASVLLTGCAQLDFEYQTAHSQAKSAMKQVRETPLPTGYKISSSGDGRYDLLWGSAGKDPNFSLVLEKNSRDSIANECKAIIQYFYSIGIKSFSAENPNDESALSPQAQIECVATLGFSPSEGLDYGGTAQVFYFGSVVSNGKKTKLFGEVNRSAKLPITETTEWKYVATIYTAVDDTGNLSEMDFIEPAEEPDAVWKGYNAALDRIGAYRAAHPETDPYSKKAIDQALNGFEKEHPAVKVAYADSNLPITRLQISPTQEPIGNLCPISVSIKKFDSEFFGVADPGKGYTIGYVDLKSDDEFGQALANYSDC